MKDKKGSIFTLSNLVVALIAFTLFLVAGISSYYMTMGEFVTARLWLLYIVLALVGAITLFLRWYWFAILYYVGCVLGWFSGRFISGLKGEFAPKAGLIVTVALIAVFTILGLLLQMKSMKKRHDRRKEEKATAKAAQSETEKLENQLLEAKKEKAAAQAALEAVAGAEQAAVAESVAQEPSAETAPQEQPEETSKAKPDGLFDEMMDKLEEQ